MLERVTSCNASTWLWAEEAGFDTPEKAVEIASDFEAPPSLEEGTTELAGEEVVTVTKTANGYVLDDAVVCETATVAAFGGSAGAHAAGTFFDADSGIAGLETWPGANPDLTVHFTANMGNNARTAARRGFQTWEDDTATIGFTVGAEHGNTPVDFSNCASFDNEIHWNEPLSGPNILARANGCWNSSGDLYTFTIAYDDSPTWHSGTGTPPTGEFDVESVAAHEWGHAMGFGLGAGQDHFTDADCGSASRATMCATTPSGANGDIWRSLEPHDIHTTEAAYD